MALFLSSDIYSDYLIFYQINIILCALYVLYIIVSSLLRRLEGAGFAMVGLETNTNKLRAHTTMMTDLKNPFVLISSSFQTVRLFTDYSLFPLASPPPFGRSRGIMLE